jgi:hypothetical protein
VPANKLAELPAMRYALSTHGTFAKSACGLLKNDSSPRKENPRLRMTRLILAEIFCRCLCLFIRTFFEGYGFCSDLPKPVLGSSHNSALDWSFRRLDRDWGARSYLS